MLFDGWLDGRQSNFLRTFKGRLIYSRFKNVSTLISNKFQIFCESIQKSSQIGLKLSSVDFPDFCYLDVDLVILRLCLCLAD